MHETLRSWVSSSTFPSGGCSAKCQDAAFLASISSATGRTKPTSKRDGSRWFNSNSLDLTGDSSVVERRPDKAKAPLHALGREIFSPPLKRGELFIQHSDSMTGSRKKW